MALLTLASCAGEPVKIDDIQACLSLYPSGAHCNHLLTSDPIDLTGPQLEAYLSDQTEPKVTMTISAFAGMKRALEELCSLYGGGCITDIKAEVKK